jgi:Integrase core domain
VGARFRARCAGVWPSQSRAERGGCVHPRMPSLRSRHQLCQLKSDAGVGSDGPELTSRHFLAWCVERQIELLHIQPGKPAQNAHVESFQGRMREECLNVSWFENLFRCTTEDRRMADRLLPRTTTQQLAISNSQRIREPHDHRELWKRRRCSRLRKRRRRFPLLGRRL